MSKKKPRQRPAKRQSVIQSSARREPPSSRRLRLVQSQNAPPRVEWERPVFSPAWQNDLALAAANTALEILGNQPTLERLVALGEKLLDAMASLAGGLILRGSAGPIACASGCDSCCHQVVGATPLELLVIAHHLSLGGVSLEALKERAKLLAIRAKGLSPRERQSKEHPCVFLHEGVCTIYPVRPLACRGVNALNRSRCEELVTLRKSRDMLDEEVGGSPGYQEPVHAAHAVSAGLQLSLSELYSLDMHPLDLTLAVNFLLSQEPRALERWLCGDAPFVTVRGAYDSHNVERLKAIGALI